MKEAFIHSEIYNDRVVNWRTMSVNIFRHEICACIMLTDICNETYVNFIKTLAFLAEML